jgi:hypothetical protein
MVDAMYSLLMGISPETEIRWQNVIKKWGTVFCEPAAVGEKAFVVVVCCCFLFFGLFRFALLVFTPFRVIIDCNGCWGEGCSFPITIGALQPVKTRHGKHLGCQSLQTFVLL